MATYFVKNGGTDAAPTTWAGAYGSLATALEAATADGDRVVIKYNGVPAADAELANDITWTFAANIELIAASEDDAATAFTPTPMGTANWLGNSTAPRRVYFAGAKTIYTYGITVRLAGVLSVSIRLAITDGSHHVYEDSYLWLGTTNALSVLFIGNADSQSLVHLKNSTIRFNNSGQGIHVYSQLVADGVTVSSDGTAPTALMTTGGNDPSGTTSIWTGCDLSFVTGTLVGNCTNASSNQTFSNCKLGAGVVPLATQAVNNLSGAAVWMYNCASGDEHYHLAHYNALGQTVVSTSIYANDGASYDGTNRASWAITTTANASYAVPYISPWIDKYHDGTSAITPSLEIVRSGSATAYQDDEVWGEFSYQGTAGFPLALFVNDRCGLAATPADQATGALGASDWTGENATSWFGKLAPGSTITPAEIGHIRARVCVGVASSTVYVDPTIRGV